MTGQDAFDRSLAAWFEAEALPPVPAGGLERLREETRARTPRPAWLAGPGSRWVGDGWTDDLASRWGSRMPVGAGAIRLLLVVLLLATLIGAAIVGGAHVFEQAPLPPALRGDLAYSLDGSIYLSDWDGSHAVRIADRASGPPAPCDGFWGEGPIWSPDGRRLAFRAAWSDTCRGTVLVHDAQGRFTASVPGGGWRISWSPDGARFATWVEEEQIAIYDADGNRSATLERPAGGWACCGDFDPELLTSSGPIRIRVHGVFWEAPEAGGQARMIPLGEPGTYLGALSPDGRLVARFSSGYLIVSAPDGSRERNLVSGGGDPMWSRAGDLIAFTRTSQEPDVDEIGVVEVATGTATMLAEVSGIGASHLLSFSPAGDRVLFWRADAGGIPSLWSVNTDGSDTRLIVRGTDWGDWQD